MERQSGEIDVLAGDFDLVHRRVGGGHFDQRLRVGEALEIFVVELVFADLECGGEALAAAGGLGGQLDLFRSCFLEEHRLGGALDDRAQFGERHRTLVDLDLAELDKALDEAAQPVLGEVELGGCGRHFGNDTSGRASSQSARERGGCSNDGFRPAYLPQPKW